MILEIQNLHKTYRQAGVNIEVLKGLELSVDKGVSVAILGQSGSGKSTFLSLLAGLDQPSKGRIFIENIDITSLAEKKLAQFRAKHLGIVFQQFHLMSNLTALENVMLPLEINGHQLGAKEKASAALEKVNLSHRKHHLPARLSGGECQRVAIARAFVVEPNLLLADEPSGNLDTRTGEQVMDLIFEMTRQKSTTLILVTHNDQLASLCDRIFDLREGQLFERN